MKKLKISRWFALVSGIVFAVILLAALITATLLQAEAWNAAIQSELSEEAVHIANSADCVAKWVINSKEPGAGQFGISTMLSTGWSSNFSENPVWSSAVLRVKSTARGSKLVEWVDTLDNRIYFSYQGSDGESEAGYAVIPLSEIMTEDEAAELITTMVADKTQFNMANARLTGVLNGGVFYPQEIDYAPYDHMTGMVEDFVPLYIAKSPPKGELVTLETSNFYMTVKGYGVYSADSEGNMDREYYKKTMLEAWHESDEVLEKLKLYVKVSFVDQENLWLSSGDLGYQYAVCNQTMPDYACVTPDTLETGDWYSAKTQLVYISIVRYLPLETAAAKLVGFYVLAAVILAALWLAQLYLFREKAGGPLKRIADAASMNMKTSGYAVSPELEAITARLDGHREEAGRLQDENARLTKAVEYARQAEQSRREMTSAVAHELKTPLAIIHSYAEGINEHIADDKREQYLNVILDETERIDAMVLEMLDLSRMEAGKTKLSRTEFDLAGLAKTVFGRLEKALAAKEIATDIEVIGDCRVNADEKRIEQVVANFATNAIKYTPAGGRIWVRLRRRWASVVLAVENQGDPIPEEKLSKVWETFYRADEARDRSGGSGLGLAIAKSIIDLHGGAVSAVNTKNGVEFSFEI